MIIRDSQLQAFKDALQAKAATELVEHCREFAPRLFQAAGESGILQVVGLGLQRARAYGFEDRPQFRFYIDMMLVLGSEFDTDPQFPWAREILQDRLSMPHIRGIALHSDISGYLDRVMGPQKEHVRQALDRFMGLPPDLLSPGQRSIGNLRGWLRRLFPQKSEDVSDDQLAEIAAEAVQQSNEFRLPVGDNILAGMMLTFGHGASHDPLYPWISSVLRDPRITSPEGRLQRLWAKLRVYAESARKYLS
jgi:hypothetical protein